MQSDQQQQDQIVVKDFPEAIDYQVDNPKTQAQPQKIFHIGKLKSKYVLVDVLSSAFDRNEIFMYMMRVNTASRKFTKDNVQSILYHAKDKSYRDIAYQSVYDQIFLKTFKKGYTSLNAQICQNLTLRYLQEYLEKHQFVKLNKLQIYFSVIEERMQDFIDFFNQKQLRVLYLDNPPTIPGKIQFIPELKYLQELSLSLSVISPGFFQDRPMKFPKTLKKLIIREFDVHRSYEIFYQLPTHLNELYLKNCYVDNFDILLYDLRKKNIKILGFEHIIFDQNIEFLKACSNNMSSFEEIAMENLQLIDCAQISKYLQIILNQKQRFNTNRKLNLFFRIHVDFNESFIGLIKTFFFKAEHVSFEKLVFSDSLLQNPSDVLKAKQRVIYQTNLLSRQHKSLDPALKELSMDFNIPILMILNQIPHLKLLKLTLNKCNINFNYQGIVILFELKSLNSLSLLQVDQQFLAQLKIAFQYYKYLENKGNRGDQILEKQIQLVKKRYSGKSFKFRTGSDCYKPLANNTMPLIDKIYSYESNYEDLDQGFQEEIIHEDFNEKLCKKNISKSSEDMNDQKDYEYIDKIQRTYSHKNLGKFDIENITNTQANGLDYELNLQQNHSDSDIKYDRIVFSGIQAFDKIYNPKTNQEKIIQKSDKNNSEQKSLDKQKDINDQSFPQIYELEKQNRINEVDLEQYKKSLVNQQEFSIDQNLNQQKRIEEEKELDQIEIQQKQNQLLLDKHSSCLSMSSSEDQFSTLKDNLILQMSSYQLNAVMNGKFKMSEQRVEEDKSGGEEEKDSSEEYNSDDTDYFNNVGDINDELKIKKEVFDYKIDEFQYNEKNDNCEEINFLTIFPNLSSLEIKGWRLESKDYEYLLKSLTTKPGQLRSLKLDSKQTQLCQDPSFIIKLLTKFEALQQLHVCINIADDYDIDKLFEAFLDAQIHNTLRKLVIDLQYFDVTQVKPPPEYADVPSNDLYLIKKTKEEKEIIAKENLLKHSNINKIKHLLMLIEICNNLHELEVNYPVDMTKIQQSLQKRKEKLIFKCMAVTDDVDLIIRRNQMVEKHEVYTKSKQSNVFMW
eukprot:403371059